MFFIVSQVMVYICPLVYPRLLLRNHANQLYAVHCLN
jgi:hypothetical protein